MTVEQVRARLYAEKVIVVLREKAAGIVVEKAAAVAAGGLRALEVTFTTPDAAEAIRAIGQAKLGLVGAGSITSLAQAKEAFDAGARFLVSPVFVGTIAAWAGRRKMVYIAGALTPQEIFDAWEAGSRPVKVFPASDLGGPSYLKHILAPLPHLELCPTGGVTVDNFAAYLAAGAKVVGMGDALTNAPEVVAGGARALTWLASNVRMLAGGPAVS